MSLAQLCSIAENALERPKWTYWVVPRKMFRGLSRPMLVKAKSADEALVLWLIHVLGGTERAWRFLSDILIDRFTPATTDALRRFAAEMGHVMCRVQNSAWPGLEIPA